MTTKTCDWTEDMDGNWETQCGGMFIVEAGSPADNDMKFCCYCGGKLLQCSYQEQYEESNAD